MRHWACGRTSCQSSLLPSWRPSWDSPPGKGLSPAAKTERTLTEDARPSKALSPSGDPLRPPARPPNRGCLSSPLWSGDAQHTEPSPAQQDGRAGGGGRGQPLARLLLRREHQRLASRDEQALCLEQLAAEGQGRGVSAEEGGVEEVAILRDDLRLRPADPGREWEHAVPAAEAEDRARRSARHGVQEGRQGGGVGGILARVVGPGEREHAAGGGLEAGLVPRVDGLVAEGESGGTGRDGIDEVARALRGEPQPGQLGGLHLVPQVADRHRAQLSAGSKQGAARLEEVGDPARTDARRHVAEEEIEAGARKEIAVTEAGEDFDVRKAQRARVVGGGAHGEEVAVDEQGGRGGKSGRDGEAQGAVAAAQVEHRSRRAVGEVAEQEQRAGVDGARREDVGGDVEGEGQTQRTDCELRAGVGAQRGACGLAWRGGSALAARATHGGLRYHALSRSRSGSRVIEGRGSRSSRVRASLGLPAPRGGGGAQQGVAELGGKGVCAGHRGAGVTGRRGRGMARGGAEGALGGQAELERADGVAAQAAVEALDDQMTGGVELVPPAVVLDQEVEGPRREDRRLGAGGEVPADCFGPDRGGQVPIEPARETVPIQGPLEDAAHCLGPPPGEEVPCAHERLRKRTSWSAGISSSRRYGRSTMGTPSGTRSPWCNSPQRRERMSPMPRAFGLHSLLSSASASASTSGQARSSRTTTSGAPWAATARRASQGELHTATCAAARP